MEICPWVIQTVKIAEKVLKITMITMFKKIEKKLSNFTRDLESIEKENNNMRILKLKNLLSNIKDLLNGFDSRLDTAEHKKCKFNWSTNKRMGKNRIEDKRYMKHSKKF